MHRIPSWMPICLALAAFLAFEAPPFANDRILYRTNRQDRFDDSPSGKSLRSLMDEKVRSNSRKNDHNIIAEIVDSNFEAEGKKKAVVTDKSEGNTDESETRYNSSDLEKQRKKYRRTDILVVCFFFVAGIWLILATIYSIILLVLLRLQARGELDIYDENLGRVVLCNGRLALHFGCILRRYAVQLEEDYQRQLHQHFEDPDAENQDNELQRIRIMSRQERRKAVEELLGSSEKQVDIECGNADKNTLIKPECDCKSIGNAVDTPKKSGTPSPLDTSFASSDEGPVCSICLAEYKSTDSIFRSKSCPHMFHGECLLSWLERRNNTECPICRVTLVSDDDIWEVVQRMRKERRKELLKENGMVYRLVGWIKSIRGGNQQPSQENDRLGSFTSSSSGSDDGNTMGGETSSLTIGVDASVDLNDGDNVAENEN